MLKGQVDENKCLKERTARTNIERTGGREQRRERQADENQGVRTGGRE